jgi:hypothetical protein
MTDLSAGRALHEDVARAAGLRDRSARHRRVWRVAPFAAALFLLVAIAGRFSGWPAAMALAGGAAIAAVLAAYALLPRRHHVVSDPEAAALDDRAALHGELRSAHWFVAHAAANDWVDHHVSGAAERVHATPWPELYARRRMPRLYGVTAALAGAAVIVALMGPTTRAAVAPGLQLGGPVMPGRPLTVADIERQLAALLATLEAADPADARPVTEEDIRKLLDAVRQSQKQKEAAGRTNSEIDKQLKERLDRAAESAKLDPDVKDALKDLKEALSTAKDQNAKAEKAAGETADKSGAPQGDAQSKSGGQQDATGQVRSDAQPGAGVGIVAMTNTPGTPSKDAGLGLGGGDSGSPNSGVMVDIGAALRRETLESGAGQSEGDPVTDLRHKTDRGQASVGFSRGAAAATERGRTNAVPVIPEARRPAARAYFQRKR